MRLSELSEVRIAKNFARFVMLDQSVKILTDRTRDVEANQILQTKQTCFRPADERAENGVGFLNCVFVLHHVADRHGARDRAVAVGNKVRCVFADDHALAQTTLAEVSHEVYDLGQGFPGRDYFEQLHIARRVEEVSAQKVRLEVRAGLGGNGGNGYSRSIAGNDTVRFSRLLEASHQFALGSEVFNYRFDDPIALGYPIEVVSQVSNGDQVGTRRSEKAPPASTSSSVQ